MDQSGAPALQRNYQITNEWDWTSPIWFLHAERKSLGGSVKFDVIIVDDSVMLRMPVKPGSPETRWVVASYSTLVWRDDRYAELVATLADPSNSSKEVSVRVNIVAEPREIGFTEIDSRDRARLLKLLSGIWPLTQ